METKIDGFVRLLTLTGLSVRVFSISVVSFSFAPSLVMSLNGPKRHFAAPNNRVANGGNVLQNPGAFYGSTGFEHC